MSMGIWGALEIGAVSVLLLGCSSGSSPSDVAAAGGSGGSAGGVTDGTPTTTTTTTTTTTMATTVTTGEAASTVGSTSGGTASTDGTSTVTGGVGGGANVSTAGSSTGGADVTALTALAVEPNPNSVLSCFVSWTTDVPANSIVQFGVDSYQWEISDETMVTEHRVLVIGMHASESYSIKAISGSMSAEGTFETGALPATIPVATVAINDSTRSQPGWTLMNMQALDSGGQGGGIVIPNSPYPPQAVIYDSEGQPVWYYVDGSTPDAGGAVSTQLTDKGILIGPSWNSQQTNGEPPREVDFAGNVLWECTHAICAAGKSVSHHAGKLSNGNYMLIEDVTRGSVKTPVFHEITPDNQEVWSLDWAELVPPPADASGDWCHGNSITVDIENNAVYANCRWVGLLKTTYQNPTYEWLLPAACANLGLGDFTYSGSQFIDSHDPEIHSDGTIIFFDNGGWMTRCAKDEYHSRIVEYQLDEATKTATLVWEFPGTFSVSDTWYDWYSPYWGDADRLANGNVLVAAGILDPNKESRVFEVSKAEGEVVWELHLPNLYGMYRADRIDPPLVRPISQ